MNCLEHSICISLGSTKKSGSLWPQSTERWSTAKGGTAQWKFSHQFLPKNLNLTLIYGFWKKVIHPDGKEIEKIVKTVNKVGFLTDFWCFYNSKLVWVVKEQHSYRFKFLTHFCFFSYPCHHQCQCHTLLISIGML